MKKQNYAVIHPFQALARSSRENIARMHTALTMCLNNDLMLLLGYLPKRTFPFPEKQDGIRVEVVGFDKSGSWDKRGRALLKEVYLEDNCLLMKAYPDGSYRDDIEVIPADAQDIRTLEAIHKAVCDYIAEKFDIDRIKD